MILIFVLISLLFVPLASAQELSLLSGVVDRVAPDNNAMGTKLGSFTAYPKLGLATGYDDNILATESDQLSDARFQIDPSLAYESGWSRNSLSLGAFLSSRLYADATSQDSLDWGVGGSGQLDVLTDTNLRGMVGYQRLTDPRGGVNDPLNAPAPVQYDLIQSSLVGNHSLNQIDLSIVANLQVYDYEEADQQYRDREVYSLTGQIGYTFSPGYSAFVRGTNTKTDFNNLSAPLPPPEASGTRVTQDSKGYRVAAGIASEITNLISGEAFIGYLDQDYDSAAFADVDGVSFGVDLEWSPSKLTTVRLTGSREVVDSTNPIAGGILYSIGGIGVKHELSQDIALNADFSYYNGDYVGSTNNREDNGYRFSLGTDYRFSRSIQVNLLYSYDDRDSNVARQSYTRNVVTVGVTLQR
jgi:hypothetical protein